MIKVIKYADADFDQQLRETLAFDENSVSAIEIVVDDILQQVRRHGDAALIALTNKFDRTQAAFIEDLTVGAEVLASALSAVDSEVTDALMAAARRIESYHQRQIQNSWSYRDESGNLLGQKIVPLARVGLYVPGGKAAYPSSVLMNAIPARVAGVKEIVMVAPTPNGVVNPVVLAAAHIAGVDRVYKIGGAQAIGALAYGTQTINKVDKIVGPGNAYVALAKKKVFGTVGIDMIAGPSEILIICDGKTDPDWIVMDLFSQAEHDELSQSILITNDESFLFRVQERALALLPEMPRKSVIKKSLEDRGALILVKDLDEACKIANSIAPEHLELSVEEPGLLLDQIDNAGAIFMGRYTSEALGDYCAGPNHVLPTSGTARFSSPLGVYDFQKRTSLIEVSESGARDLGRIAAKLAREEGLEAHARSAEKRFQS
ncbi:MAG: histidinol dehydrogenase [Burkholderiales bacterium]|jgi:histidinol dehydrogenase|nr:histidinol dehydrogenase [Pseudomonadota bacterium]MDA1012163.1 histidinol dehydrogenase [Pseudomonadota bacterium]|tara:strand:- start:722 stop:2017 length:1296 start_codon:yes stop_codon:yes gene_type:complete